jgi:NNP family nitrate/nitrite transporter-like MFS transporter
MLMFGIVWVSLMWMYFTEVRPLHAKNEKERAATQP